MNADILEQCLKELPNLRALHVTNCMKLDHHDVLRFVRHTPVLESLSLTTWVSGMQSTCRVSAS